MGRTFNLEINTTKKCNMSCTYCFEKETIKKANIEEKKSIIQPEEIIKFLENNIKYLNKTYSSLNVSLWGGEPTLNMDGLSSIILILKIQIELFKKEGKLSKNFDLIFRIFTNGKNYSNIIKLIDLINSFKLKLEVQISYDGKESQRGNKLLNSMIYDNIIKIDEYIKNMNNISLDLKSTLLLEDDFYEKYLEFIELNKILNSKIQFNPTIEYYQQKNLDEYSQAEINKIKNKILDEFLQIYKSEEQFYKEFGYFMFGWFSNYNLRNEDNKIIPSKLRKTCSAGINIHCIDGNKHHMCHADIYQENSSENTKSIYDHTDNIKNNTTRHNVIMDLEKDEICAKCEATVCFSCPSINKKITNSLYINQKTILCHVYQIFGLFDKKMNKNIFAYY